MQVLGARIRTSRHGLSVAENKRGSQNGKLSRCAPLPPLFREDYNVFSPWSQRRPEHVCPTIARQKVNYLV